MRALAPLPLLLLLLPAPALADDCAERLRALLATDLTLDGPYTAMNTNVMAGTEQTYRQSFVSDRHFLVEPLTPPGLPATLHYEGSAWHADGAGGWTLAWQTDAEDAARGIAEQRQASADAVESATCTEVDGALEIEGVLGPTPHFGPEATVAYVVDAATNQVLELSYAYVVGGVPVTADYQISRAPGLSLPLPPAN
jgi:hypothetical protein